MADLHNSQRSPKFGKGLLLDGEILSKLAENPIFQRLSKNKWIQKFPPWIWGGLAIGALFSIIWIVNNRVAPMPETTPTPVGGNTTELAVDILVKLSLIVGLIYGALWVFRRWRGVELRKGTKKIDVLETVHLSPRRALHLVQAGDRVVLIGATDQNVTFISDIEATPQVPEEEPPPVFADVLVRKSQAGAINTNGGALSINGGAVNTDGENDIAFNKPGGELPPDPSTNG